MFLSDARFIVRMRYEERLRRSSWAPASHARQATSAATTIAPSGFEKDIGGFSACDMSAHRERARGRKDAPGADQLDGAGARGARWHGRLDLVLGLGDDRRLDSADADLGGGVEAAGREHRDGAADTRNRRREAVEARAPRTRIVGRRGGATEGSVVRVAADGVGKEAAGEIV